MIQKNVSEKYHGKALYDVCLHLFDFEKYYTRLSKNLYFSLRIFDAETFSKYVHFILANIEISNFKFNVLHY